MLTLSTPTQGLESQKNQAWRTFLPKTGLRNFITKSVFCVLLKKVTLESLLSEGKTKKRNTFLKEE